MREEIYIISAVRTPIGSFNGAFSNVPAQKLGSLVITEALRRARVENDKVSEVILGQIYTAGLGQNPARQASILAKIPYTVPAWSVNMLCGSGLKAVALGCQAIWNEDAKIVVAGGQENMSQVPHTIRLRSEIKVGDGKLVDSLLYDGLTDAFYNCHMGVTCENVVKEYGITREEQDRFAYNSQMKAMNAINNGYFQKEIISVNVSGRKGSTEVSTDEFPRPDTTVEGLSQLMPCFMKGPEASVTPGNSTGLNDGAAAVVLMGSNLAKRENAPVLAKIIAYSQAGLSPHIMGLGLVPAIRQTVKKANWTLNDVDLFEINEPYAGVSLAVIKELAINPEKVNISGGAIALGYPLGSSGGRILVTLLHAMERLNKKKGVVALCMGGGMGIAIYGIAEGTEGIVNVTLDYTKKHPAVS